ncbi:MAG: rhodanese-like domain-containing protein [Pseudomonadota bacterium]
MFRDIFGVAATLLYFGAVQAEACTPNYVVEKGDSLSKIARAELGSIFEYRTIYDVNRDVIGRNPNRIYVGQELSIPCEGAPVGDLRWSVMPSPEMIAELSGQARLQILDIRKPKEVAKGAIPGAITIPYAAWRGPADNLGAPPSEESLAALIGDAGLRLDQPIVIVHSKEHPMRTGSAAVVYWLLKSSGAEQLAILRGGYKAWEQADKRLASRPAPPRPYEAKVAFNWEWRADEVTVYGIATGQLSGHLLDARPHGVFERFDNVGKALATTLPGARNLSAPSLLASLRGEVNVEDGVETVLETFRALGSDGNTGQVVTFCHVGELAALNWFYASELAGMPNIKLYPESVVGWTHNGGDLFAPIN